VLNLLQNAFISLCYGCVLFEASVWFFTVVLVVLFRQSFVINIQGVKKITRHSLFHKRKAVSSAFCATLCRDSGRSTHEDSNVASRILKSWYLLYYSGHEIRGPCNQSAHTFPPPKRGSSKRSPGVFTNKWAFVVEKLSPVLTRVFFMSSVSSLAILQQLLWVCATCQQPFTSERAFARTLSRVMPRVSYYSAPSSASIMEDHQINRFHALRCCKSR